MEALRHAGADLCFTVDIVANDHSMIDIAGVGDPEMRHHTRVACVEPSTASETNSTGVQDPTDESVTAMARYGFDRGIPHSRSLQNKNTQPNIISAPGDTTCWKISISVCVITPLE